MIVPCLHLLGAAVGLQTHGGNGVFISVFSSHYVSMLGDVCGALPGKDKTSTEHKMLEASTILNINSK